MCNLGYGTVAQGWRIRSAADYMISAVVVPLDYVCQVYVFGSIRCGRRPTVPLITSIFKFPTCVRRDTIFTWKELWESDSKERTEHWEASAYDSNVFFDNGP